MDRNRRTGRTTRMLMHAVAHALDGPGRTVVVIGHHHAYARELARKAYEIVRSAVGGWSTREDYMLILLPNGSSLAFRAAAPEWEVGQERWRLGVPNLEVFEDHAVAEMRLLETRRAIEDRVREFAKQLGVEHLLRSDEEVDRAREAVKEAARRAP